MRNKLTQDTLPIVEKTQRATAPPFIGIPIKEKNDNELPSQVMSSTENALFSYHIEFSVTICITLVTCA